MTAMARLLTSVTGLLVVLLLGSRVPAAQSASTSAASVDTPHLALSTSTSPSSVANLGKVSLHVDITPKPKMHLYAPGEKDGIPVTLTLEPAAGLKIDPPQFPPAQKYFFEPLKLTQLVYSKPFKITQKITLTQPLARSALTIKGTFRYQACDDTVCYLPKAVPVSWELKN